MKHGPQPVALTPQTLSSALARHLTLAVRARLMGLQWAELLQIPFDTSIHVIRGLRAESQPAVNDLVMLRASDVFLGRPRGGFIAKGYEPLASFRFAINDLRGEAEQFEEALAEESPRLVRYVAMNSHQMVELLTCYASYLIEDYCRDLVCSQDISASGASG